MTKIPYNTPTTKTLETITFIQRYQDQHDFAPTLKEIAGGLGLKLYTGSTRVERLKEKGWLSRANGKNDTKYMIHWDMIGKGGLYNDVRDLKKRVNKLEIERAKMIDLVESLLKNKVKGSE